MMRTNVLCVLFLLVSASVYGEWYRVDVNSLRVRNYPSTSGKVVGHFSSGTVFEGSPNCYDAQWIDLWYNGQTCCVSANMVEEVAAPVQNTHTSAKEYKLRVLRETEESKPWTYGVLGVGLFVFISCLLLGCFRNPLYSLLGVFLLPAFVLLYLQLDINHSLWFLTPYISGWTTALCCYIPYLVLVEFLIIGSAEGIKALFHWEDPILSLITILHAILCAYTLACLMITAWEQASWTFVIVWLLLFGMLKIDTSGENIILTDKYGNEIRAHLDGSGKGYGNDGRHYVKRPGGDDYELDE